MIPNDKLWCKINEKSSSHLPNLLKVVECVLAIPIGNDFVERVFSIMQNLCTDERSSLSVETIKAEICTKVNFSMSCLEFSDYVLKNNELLKAAKSNKKYSFNCK